MTARKPLGARIVPGGAEISVWSRHASQIDLCLFDDKDRESRLPMERDGQDHFTLFVPGLQEGARYGFRAHGIHSPLHGLWYDPAKLLVDPYATMLDRPFVMDPALSTPGVDTAGLVPRAILRRDKAVPAKPLPADPAGLIYEVNVKAMTMRHPDVPERQRGTLRALAHPALIAHFKAIGVSHLELMPIVAWIDERHLPPLGLSNAWGYNPVVPMALDPRLAPGGMTDLADTVAALHAEGIGVILDLVFNHTGESDRFGPTLSFRGLDNLAYYRHAGGEPGTLINDTGCGNQLACDHPVVHDLIIDTLHHFIDHGGVDGFRFDLATILGRTATGFRKDARLLDAIAHDERLKDRVLIAEPWDIGPGGYQLGHFPARFFEWNDRARDDIRMTWRGDRHKIGVLATALAGSSPIFGDNHAHHTRSVNFIAAHDGFTLMDLVSHERKHNEANGEDNRDGHNDNHSWNNGAEGASRSKAVNEARKADVKALLSTLFATRGLIMIAAGDEFGRSQGGNNNAYAQDNELTWLDWETADRDIMAHVHALSAIRRRFRAFSRLEFLTGHGDVAWYNRSGEPMRLEDWNEPDADHLTMVLTDIDNLTGKRADLAIAFNRGRKPVAVTLPGLASDWTTLLGPGTALPPRSVGLFTRGARH